MTAPWKIRGDLVLSCNCDVFCPCVVSLGKSRPSYGACHTWWGLRIREGHAGGETLDGLKAAVLMDVPGPLADGGWSLAVYIDEGASEEAAAALTEILSGRAGGPMGWFSIMVAEHLGVRRVPIGFEDEGKGWRVSIPRTIDGLVEPIPAPAGDGRTRIANTAYWVAPEVVVCTGRESRFRDFGRNWNLSGRSGEYAEVDWTGP